jgi:hypothetical protein
MMLQKLKCRILLGKSPRNKSAVYASSAMSRVVQRQQRQQRRPSPPATSTVNEHTALVERVEQQEGRVPLDRLELGDIDVTTQRALEPRRQGRR